MSEQTTVAPVAVQAQVEYRDVPGFPGYRVGSDGGVWSCRSSHGEMLNNFHRLQPRMGSKGYTAVTLCLGGPKIQRLIHRIVLEAFIGMCPDGMECRHLNGVRDDCRLDNLAWGTPEENQADKIAHGTTNRGERQWLSKLTATAVREIRLALAAGEKPLAVAKKHGVSVSNVYQIRSGKAWSWLDADVAHESAEAP